MRPASIKTENNLNTPSLSLKMIHKPKIKMQNESMPVFFIQIYNKG